MIVIYSHIFVSFVFFDVDNDKRNMSLLFLYNI